MSRSCRRKRAWLFFYFEHFSRNMDAWHQNVEKLLARLWTDRWLSTSNAPSMSKCDVKKHNVFLLNLLFFAEGKRAPRQHVV